MFLESTCQGPFNIILYFEFGQKIYELYSTKDLNPHTLHNNRFQVTFNSLALDTKAGFHFDFDII
jgi:hypothetical protein